MYKFSLDRLTTKLDRVSQIIAQHHLPHRVREVGSVTAIHRGVVHIHGLADAMNEELLQFPGGNFGWIFNLDRDSIGCVLLDQAGELKVGDEVRRTRRTLDVPVGERLLGRVIDPVGRPLDGKGPIETTDRLAVEQPAAAIMDRKPVSIPLQTGIKVVDALVPIGRGQRQLIIGDRQTGKTSMAVDTILNQRDSGVVCVYCAIGQRNSAVAKVVDQINRNDAINRCVVVVGESNAPAGLQFVAPYAAMSIGEYFMEQGQHVLVVFDEMTAHAKAFRELSLLMRRSPGREAYPGDVFYVHSRLLERSTCLKEELGGGSLTAIPIVETEAQNVTAYIPTNLISITDGQIYLSRDHFQRSIFPAVDVGRSVSRVGGKAQLKAYRSVTGPLRLAYAQFEELEKFARFSSQLDEATRQKLVHGQRVREILKQRNNDARHVVDQVITFVAVANGLFDRLPISDVPRFEHEFSDAVRGRLPGLCHSIETNSPLSPQDIRAIVDVCREIIGQQETGDANA